MRLINIINDDYPVPRKFTCLLIDRTNYTVTIEIIKNVRYVIKYIYEIVFNLIINSCIIYFRYKLFIRKEFLLIIFI